jgi:predicted ABC-type sugar transport system permease subunit
VVIGNGLEQVGAAEWLRLTAAAALVVIALAIDRWRRRETANHPHHAT